MSQQPVSVSAGAQARVQLHSALRAEASGLEVKAKRWPRCTFYERTRAAAGRVVIQGGFLGRVALAAAVASAALVLPGLPDLAAAALAGALFLGVGQLIGMVREELRAALGPRGLLARRRA